MSETNGGLKRRRGAVDSRWAAGDFELPPDETADRIGPVEYRDPRELKPHPRNPRTHPDAQLEEIMVSLERRGQYRTVTISEDNTILAGHGVVEAARRLGWSKIAVQVFHGTEEEALALLVGDNELSRLAVDLDGTLTSALQAIYEAQGDLRGTGWSPTELRDLTRETEEAIKKLQAPKVPEMDASLRLGEYHDYIVLLFHRWLDFAWALDHFGIKDVADNRPKRKKVVGVWRVIDGAQYRRRITEELATARGQGSMTSERAGAADAALESADDEEAESEEPAHGADADA